MENLSVIFASPTEKKLKNQIKDFAVGKNEDSVTFSTEKLRGTWYCEAAPEINFAEFGSEGTSGPA